jgi:hypothetical protein
MFRKSGAKSQIFQTSDSYYTFRQSSYPKLLNKFETELPTFQGKGSTGFFPESEPGPNYSACAMSGTELLIVQACISAPEIWNEIDSPPSIGNSTSPKASEKLVQGFGTKKGKPQSFRITHCFSLGFYLPVS